MPFERGEILSQRAFSIYTDIRKLQDKAKTSYTLSTRRLRFGYNNSLAEVHPELITEWSEKNRALLQAILYNDTGNRFMVKSLLLQEICDKIKIDNILSKIAENHKK